jgi:hypothetical protein
MDEPAIVSGEKASPKRVEVDRLRALLVAHARAGTVITYGEIAAVFGAAWTQGYGASLKRALNLLGKGNQEAGEPFLMTLVVNKETGLPGKGFYLTAGISPIDEADKREIFARERLRCHQWPWD